MSLLAPLFLLGALTIAIPFWLHRLQTQSSDREPFSSAMLLETTDATPIVSTTVGEWTVTLVGPGAGLTDDALVHVVELGETAWYVVADGIAIEVVLAALPRE